MDSNLTVPGLSDERPVISSTERRPLRGSDPGTYTWNEIASSIITWVFPIVSVLLRVLFESSNTARTFFILLRRIDFFYQFPSPISFGIFKLVEKWL